MDEPRANLNCLSLVWSTRGEDRLRMEIGLDARSIGLSLGENGGDFFLDILSYRAH
jgi:hypothetical protein